jgi:hypothetical protein
MWNSTKPRNLKSVHGDKELKKLREGRVEACVHIASLTEIKVLGIKQHIYNPFPCYLFSGDRTLEFLRRLYKHLGHQAKIHISFSSLSYDRSVASSKANSPHGAIQCSPFQFPVHSLFLKVIQ